MHGSRIATRRPRTSGLARARRVLVAGMAGTMVIAGCRGKGAETPDSVKVSGVARASVPREESTPADTTGVLMIVYKSPTCGCCRSWVEHMKKAGFRVRAVDLDDVQSVKTRYGVPGALASCHTAVIESAAGGPFVVEGHVPAEDVRRLLRPRMGVRGLAVAGMPAGAPGMELPDGRRDHYDVMSFREDGVAAVVARH